MRLFISAVASVAALSLLFVGGSGPSRATTIARTSPAFVTPDAHRTRAFFSEIVYGNGSFPIPQLNGLGGTMTYYSDVPPEYVKAKYYTAWGTYGNPPQPSNGGTVVAHIVMHFYYTAPVFGGSTVKSSITYARLSLAKTYSIDVWDVKNAPVEYRLWSIGSPTNGNLTFVSPLEGFGGQSYDVVDLELVQNP